MFSVIKDTTVTEPQGQQWNHTSDPSEELVRVKNSLFLSSGLDIMIPLTSIKVKYHKRDASFASCAAPSHHSTVMQQPAARKWGDEFGKELRGGKQSGEKGGEDEEEGRGGKVTFVGGSVGLFFLWWVFKDGLLDTGLQQHPLHYWTWGSYEALHVTVCLNEDFFFIIFLFGIVAMPQPKWYESNQNKHEIDHSVQTQRKTVKLMASCLKTPALNTSAVAIKDLSKGQNMKSYSDFSNSGGQSQRSPTIKLWNPTAPKLSFHKLTRLNRPNLSYNTAHMQEKPKARTKWMKTNSEEEIQILIFNLKIKLL